MMWFAGVRARVRVTSVRRGLGVGERWFAVRMQMSETAPADVFLNNIKKSSFFFAP